MPFFTLLAFVSFLLLMVVSLLTRNMVTRKAIVTKYETIGLLLAALARVTYIFGMIEAGDAVTVCEGVGL